MNGKIKANRKNGTSPSRITVLFNLNLDLKKNKKSTEAIVIGIFNNLKK
jgi:hypothetical protein